MLALPQQWLCWYESEVLHGWIKWKAERARDGTLHLSRGSMVLTREEVSEQRRGAWALFSFPPRPISHPFLTFSEPPLCDSDRSSQHCCYTMLACLLQHSLLWWSWPNQCGGFQKMANSYYMIQVYPHSRVYIQRALLSTPEIYVHTHV